MEIQSVETIVKVLNDNVVQYLIVGGLAVNAHGYQRLTDDVDLVIGLAPENITRGLHELQSIGYLMAIPVTPEAFANAELREHWRAEKGMLVLKMWSDLHRRTVIDVFVYEPFDFVREFALASKREVLPGVSAPVVRLDTLLQMKRTAGRPQDLADIASLEELRQLSDNQGND